jgi:epoxyqueuosine reductase
MKSLLNLSSEFLQSQGILDWGYTEEYVPRSLNQYEKWVNQAGHGPLGYLADHRKDLRRDLRNVYPEFQSALVFLFSYQPTKKYLLEHQHHEVAAYALGFEGEDYHHALKRRLDSIFLELKNQHPELERFISLDAQPVLERDLAHRAGLGWFGKNSMLINQKEGSYFILGSLLLNQKLNLEVTTADVDHCGQCNACVEACPTQAIDPETRTLKASQCISTYTIETFKDALPPAGFEQSRGEIFGCDICQDVCPWNRKPLLKTDSALSLRSQFQFLRSWFLELPKNDLQQLLEQETNRGLKKKLVGTALDRPGRLGWLKNLKALKCRLKDG